MGLELREDPSQKINKLRPRAVWKPVKVGLSPLEFRNDLATLWVESLKSEKKVYREREKVK